MVSILLSGCGGAMGRAIANAVATRDDCVITAGIDPTLPQDLSFPVYATAAEVPASGISVVVDFSHPAAVAPLLDYATQHALPLVEATTGLAGDTLALLERQAKTIPVFFSANMSLGVNLLLELARKATQILGDSFDIEIIEKHHNQKIDAPSGTALALADAIAQELSPTPTYVYDRHNKHEKRSAHEIGIHSIRGGTIVGEHDVIFAGKDEVLTLSHTAYSKELFATGAIRAALFLHDKPAGFYSMKQLIDSL